MQFFEFERAASHPGVLLHVPIVLLLYSPLSAPISTFVSPSVSHLFCVFCLVVLCPWGACFACPGDRALLGKLSQQGLTTQACKIESLQEFYAPALLE